MNHMEGDQMNRAGVGERPAEKAIRTKWTASPRAQREPGAPAPGLT